MWPFKKKTDKTNINDPLIHSEPLSQGVIFEQIGQSSVTWLPFLGSDKLQNDALLIHYFNNLAEISSPIRKYADLAKLVKPYSTDKSGKEIENNKALEIFKTFWSKYSEMCVIYDLLLGNAYVNAMNSLNVESLKKEPSELFLLPTEYVKIISNNEKDIRKVKALRYELVLKNLNKLEIEPQNILHLKTNNFLDSSINGLYGISRLVSCVKNIQSIASGYGAKVSLYDNGPRVIITGKGQNEYQSVNTDETTEEITEKINNTYGRTKGQFQIAVTKTPLDVSNISLDVNSLQITQNNASDFRRICTAFNQDSKIFGDPEATTYDNMETAESAFANGAFKSYIEDRFNKFTIFLNQWWPDIMINPNFLNIEKIREFEQENEKKLFERVEKGLMTRNQYNEVIGEPKVNVPEFDEYMTFYNGQWTNISQNGNSREEEIPNQEA